MPKVGIVMGSDSDLKVMSKAAATLEKFGIDYEMTIISAHRMPDVFFDWAKAAEGKGIKVIIAGAGMAAHLPGMCAALFPMPVIGIPMSGKNLEGRDALYSIVQMPPGLPGCYSCNGRRYECGNSCSKDACNVRSGAFRETESLFCRDERYGTGKSRQTCRSWL